MKRTLTKFTSRIKGNLLDSSAIFTVLLTALAGSSLLSPAYAAGDATAYPTGNAEAGKAKSALCTACHGADGNSITPNFPHLAGQVPGYIAKQLAAFKSGSRQDATMAGMVAALSDQDMLDLDAFYASQAPKAGEVSADNEADALKGEAIYRSGIKEFSVSACMACHSPDGKGVLPNYPRLAGQTADYIEKQLKDFKSGARQDAMMNPIAFPLSETQIKQLALYISGLY